MSILPRSRPRLVQPVEEVQTQWFMPGIIERRASGAHGAASQPSTVGSSIPKHRDVLREVAGGGTTGEAAGRLFISEATFKTHLSRAYDTLGVTDCAAAVRAAHDQRWL